VHRSTIVTRAFVASTFLTAASAQVQGPSSSRSPYVLPVAAGVQTVSIATVGDSFGGYALVGSTDGLGARSLSGGRFELLVNHELGGTSGVVRAHGFTGAFVSKWEIDATTFQVHSGADLIQQAIVVNGNGQISRLCSADLPPRSALFPTDQGSLSPAIFLSGEESGDEGRGFAHVVTGPEAGLSYELPSLGKMRFENLLARPKKARSTVVACLDDSSPGQVYFYVGLKSRFGNAVDRAGLTNGDLFGVRVPGVPLELRSGGLNGATTFELASLGDVSGTSGAQLRADSTAIGVTQFLRPEDGVWDLVDPRVFYFVTTDRFDSPAQVGRSRLWKLSFSSHLAPQLGGTIEMLLDGTEGQQMLDNMTIDHRGHLLIQEDPGSQAHLARIWEYTIATDSLELLAEHDPAFFTVGGASFLTVDEESSGIIDASSVIGPGWFLLDVMAHYSLPGELVQGGQLLALFNPDSQ
jgi:hypothetical protein